MAAPVTVSFALPSTQLIGVVLLATTESVPAARAVGGGGVAVISCVIHSQPEPSISPITNLVGLVTDVASGKVYLVAVTGVVTLVPVGIVAGPANKVKLPELSFLYILY